MTNPNIAGINTLRGQSSTRQYVNIVPGDLLVNDVDSNEVLKVDSITISNTDPANPHDVSVEFVRNNVAYKVVSTVSVPADSTLNVIVRDYGFYLLEGDKLRIFGSFSGALHATCSYEQISDVSVPVRPDDYDPAVPFDAFFNQTVLLLHGDGTNGAQNNTFIDGSSNNLTITRNGNTTQGTFTPFSAEAGKWSASLVGSSDGLTSTSNAAFGFGSGDFTIEFWVIVCECVIHTGGD
jgi:hypothetical protein